MRTVYLFDDHKVFRNGLKLIIEKIPGFRVTGETGSGMISEEQLIRDHPDLIFIDVHLKGRNSFDLASRIRQIVPASRIILMSMFAEEGYLNDSMAAGASAFLFKPSIAENLESLVASLFQDA